MQRVITALVLIPVVVLVVFKAPFWLYALVLAALAMLCTQEYLRIVGAHGLQPLRVLTYLAVLAVLGDYYLSIALRGQHPSGATGWQMTRDPFFQYTVLLVVVSLAPLILLACAMHIEDLRQALPSAAASYMAVPYIGITLGFLLFARGLIADGAFAVFFLMLVVWTGDIFAYYVGRAIGKHKLAPRISPGKSWEGAGASIIGSIIVGTLLLVYNTPVAQALTNWKLLGHPSALSGLAQPKANVIWIAVLASASINVAAQLGDLVESMMKRGAGLKDSGALLPGHGGALDRVDALLLASPVLWYYCSFGLIHF